MRIDLFPIFTLVLKTGATRRSRTGDLLTEPSQIRNEKTTSGHAHRFYFHDLRHHCRALPWVSPH